MILIVPCFNEARRMSNADFLLHANLFEKIIFVNDGSTDETGEILSEIQRKMGDHCHIQTLSENKGKGEAIRQGMIYYLDHLAMNSASDHIGFTDADLSSPLTEIYRLSKVQNEVGCGFVQGARVALMGRNIQRSPLKHYLGRIGATLISELLDLKVYDTQGGAKVFSTAVVEELFMEPFISKWLFDCELYLRAKKLGVSVYEEPLRTWIDQTIDSKVRPSSYFSALLDLARIKKRYK